ncbi:MAG: hypothetical protein A2788_00985 [Candidatus Abawacabacteria bacterium RIFCSPHIGHO2_01_FULL_46_8]|uniref:Adenylate kinase n=1 Tax=Candidatus Abawacabacteria bacterium RIFCSPHIGHO2_01_FULL_46_8 TaxID=1817815 RepID=A0A1F4XMS3_9BACT|nr:MAG: hypothetical protein A2788_00985 [Candidatus Abawacabacteria bacterium RIFCSPHIGHO2_01_FULL_46_8]
MDLIFLGIQGSGKGTQARLLADQFGLLIFETGKEFRKIAEQDTALGRQIKATIDAGKLVPYDLPPRIAEEFVQQLGPDQRVIFDGVPREIPQAELFWPMLAKYKRDYLLVNFLLTEAEGIRRLTGRLNCPNPQCNAIYPADEKSATCAKCGSTLEKRVDDADLASIKQRMSIFIKQTMPVIEEQKVLGRAIEINAQQSVEAVYQDLLEALAARGVISTNQ